jgi:gliding motility-associated-like protein
MQENKVKILFVCHGNICRSPMAERVMKHLVAESGMEEKFEIASAAMRTDAIGCQMYSPARRELEAHGVNGDGHEARLMTLADYDYYDLIIGMDPTVALKIYDRYGNLVVETTDGWDGLDKNGNYAMPNVYFYVATLPNGDVVKGNVELLNEKR